TKCSALDAVGESASSLFPPLHVDTPDGERFLQRLAGRFLCFALMRLHFTSKLVEHSHYLPATVVAEAALLAVLFGAFLFHPVAGQACELLGNGDVRHDRGYRTTVPI